ncbi:hypothetical protein [Aliikangiella maris]|uniref:Uncharacterized protein n=2 Tax=Aliikangiella maris TaxID=3162458 RepID=A0ABV3MSQ0_9GAMM
MREFNTDINEQHFNLIWHSLASREKELLKIISDNEDDDDSEVGPIASNDLMYLRLYQKSLREKAEKAAFDKGVFSLSDEIIDLADMEK